MSHGPASQAPYEAGLSGAFSDHNRQGAWASEQGTNAYCWEAATMESVSENNPRSAAPAPAIAWNTTIIQSTPVTKGNGMYDSSLPNH